ncbi:hypothetical protein CPB84DRAFT_1778129 [Gymnopilus junonius]|uniref:Uncharacterized protein n=1 Tax=Gymnopilus junonius TaxID=109634 RepID=A0A9P5NLF0_GYMJU|nr:hypothetical protein CPB84DRAFT_1778129 [Gymnopilus junonius]
MQTGEMITHLHVMHDYRLVECSLLHEHTPNCFELPQNGFLTTTDAEMNSERLGEPMPSTTSETGADKISALTSGSSTDVASVDLSTEAGPLSSPLSKKIRLCMADFAKANSRIPDIEKVTDFLIEEKVDSDDCGEVGVTDVFNGANVRWSLKQVVAWRNFYKSWFSKH